jgi:predicted deacylase
MTATQVTSEIDYAADGKQTGYLRMPHSVHRSAYGWIPVPITVIQNDKGPTLVISAGVHGDEYEGQIAVAELAEQLNRHSLSGMPSPPSSRFVAHGSSLLGTVCHCSCI